MKGFRLQIVGYSILFFLFTIAHPLSTAYAVTDPLQVPNNKFGVHIISTSDEELNMAASLVNSTNGDWGYVTLVIEDHDRDTKKWQKVFDKLRTLHLIPIVRLATHPVGNAWVKPSESEPQNWADFLNSLNWPAQNRYVVVYNEPNHALEWGGSVDPIYYAQVLNQTIDSLKAKSDDFFVLNAGFDASAPSETPNYQDQLTFMQTMQNTVPGIFEKLDGWVSHSYPNPGFVGLPTGNGRGSVRTWLWEEQVLRNLGIKKDLPIFITETGWKHAEGQIYNPNFPTAEVTGNHYKIAFENAWNDPKIVAVTPFILNYPQPPFDHFTLQNTASFEVLQKIAKNIGQPFQQTLAQFSSVPFPTVTLVNQTYPVKLTVKNIGQSIWGEKGPIRLVAQKGSELGISALSLPQGFKISPGEEYTFEFNVKAPQSGHYEAILNMYQGDYEFENGPIKLNFEAQSEFMLFAKKHLPKILQPLAQKLDDTLINRKLTYSDINDHS